MRNNERTRLQVTHVMRTVLRTHASHYAGFTRGMGRDTPVNMTKQLNLRIEESDEKACDRLAAELSKRSEGATITRAEAARIAMRKGFEALLAPEKKTR